TVKDLTLTNNLTIGGHIITAGNTPTITPQAAAGQGATATIEGNDTSGTITITTGTNTTTEQLANISFANPYNKAPRIVFSPASRESTKVGAYYDPAQTTNSGYSIMVDQLPQPSTTYTFTYFITQ
ncbi:MAG: hypothetical protein QG645_649, partial [Patescibacteria group bacterium]|nr:hypothetical protein [Patescibacteria group bacterium]